MSSAIDFLVPEARMPLRQSVFRRYFTSRNHYTTTNDTAAYFNRDTGVGFSFHHDSKVLTRISLSPGGRQFNFAGVTFTMPTGNSSIFQLEAEIELSAFARRFGLYVETKDGCTDNPGGFNPKSFRDSWDSEMNLRLMRQMKRKNGKDRFAPAAMEEQQLKNVWKWNYFRRDIESCYPSCYQVPRIMLVDRAGQAATTALWDSESILALPKVDHVLCIRRKRSSTGRITEEVANRVLVDYEALFGSVDSVQLIEDPSPHAIILGTGGSRFQPWQGLPVRSMGLPFVGELNEIPAEQVFDLETVEQHNPPLFSNQCARTV